VDLETGTWFAGRHQYTRILFIGGHGTASRYQARPGFLNKASVKHCLRSEFLIDNPRAPETCEQTQIFALLADVIEGNDSVALMERPLRHYVFRALGMSGLYEWHFEEVMHP
jgi:hypothetical protein